MSVTEAPHGVLTAFVRCVLDAGATASHDDIEQAGRRLLALWQEPERAFHNLDHLVAVLGRVNELADATRDPAALRLAVWYHGAVFSTAALVVYARRGGEDALAGAALAREELTALGVPVAMTERVHDLIENLHRHDPDDDDIDALALCDAHLGTLSLEPGRYEAYRAAIRAEYAHIAEEDYVGARLAIVTKLLTRRRLFSSPFTLGWEQPARENLTAELGRLRMRMAALDGPVHAPASATTEADAAVTVSGQSRTGPAPEAGSPPDTHSAPETDDGLETDAAPETDEDLEITLAPSAEDDACRFGIEREPSLGPRRRREKSKRRPMKQLPVAPPPPPEDDDSTGTLFRPPPRLPRV